MKYERPPCKGYFDLRVDRLDDHMIDAYITNGYKCIALNTTIDGSVLDLETSNRRKRKNGSSNLKQEPDWVPNPPFKEHDENKITILTRLTIKISSIGQLRRAMISPNYKLYDIHSVEPLTSNAMQEAVSAQGIDIINCNITVNITAKDYKNAVDKSTHFELAYVPMLSDSVARQEGLTIGHLLHIKGKSKNLIVSSGAVNWSQIRNVHDVMNICILLGLSKDQMRYAVARGCQAVILQTIGRRKGKSAFSVTMAEQAPQDTNN